MSLTASLIGGFIAIVPVLLASFMPLSVLLVIVDILYCSQWHKMIFYNYAIGIFDICPIATTSTPEPCASNCICLLHEL